MFADKKHEYHKLVSARDESGLVYASRDVYSVCKTSETIIRKFVRQNFIMTRPTYTKILSCIVKQFIGHKDTYFKVETEHACGSLLQVNLIRLVAEKYLTIRCYHIAKLDNVKSDATSKRKLFKKQIQREGH